MSKKSKKNKSRVKVQTTPLNTAALNITKPLATSKGRVTVGQAAGKAQLTEIELKNRYGYVNGELKLIAVIAGAMFLTLIGLSFFLR